MACLTRNIKKENRKPCILLTVFIFKETYKEKPFGECVGKGEWAFLLVFVIII